MWAEILSILSLNPPASFKGCPLRIVASATLAHVHSVLHAMGFMAYVVLGLFGAVIYSVIDSLRAGLGHIPGPFLARFTSLHRLIETYRAGYVGDYLTPLHDKYGDVVRIGPRSVSVADPAAIPTIYNTKGRFWKVRRNLDLLGKPLLYAICTNHVCIGSPGSSKQEESQEGWTTLSPSETPRSTVGFAAQSPRPIPCRRSFSMSAVSTKLWTDTFVAWNGCARNETRSTLQGGHTTVRTPTSSRDRTYTLFVH